MPQVAISRTRLGLSAYALMAHGAGIDVPPSLVINADGLSHFLVKRFDRYRNQRIHIQSLAALRGLNYRQEWLYDYSLLMTACNRLSLGQGQREEAFRRTVFNVAAAVTDDHLKNFSFQCGPDGQWRLGLAYDLTFSAPLEVPVARLPPSPSVAVDGERRGITTTRLLEFARNFHVPDPVKIIDAVLGAVGGWPTYASEADCSPEDIELVAQTLPSV